MIIDKNIFQQFKRLLKAVAWVVVAAAIAYFSMSREDSDEDSATLSPITSTATDGTTATTFASPDDYATAGATTTAGSVEDIAIPGGTPNQTVSYPGFTVHYNSQTHTPNCVVYTLTASETRGRSERQDAFSKDEKVIGCASPEEYAGTGYDRGHMAPAGDFKWDDEAMASTFMMSNICPQNHRLNKGTWNDLEIKVREWARRDKELVVYTGPIYADKKKPEKIVQRRDNKKGRVAVPTAFFKVVYAPTARPERAIAFIMPNEPCGDDLRQYVVTIDEVERQTGIDFLSALPADRQARLQATSNSTLWFFSRNG